MDDTALQVDRVVVRGAREQGLSYCQRIARLGRRIEAEVEADAFEPGGAELLHPRGSAGQTAVQELLTRQCRIIARGRRLQRRGRRVGEQVHDCRLGAAGDTRNARSPKGKKARCDPRDTG